MYVGGTKGAGTVAKLSERSSPGFFLFRHQLFEPFIPGPQQSPATEETECASISEHS
jgi:hypothetical protein